MPRALLFWDADHIKTVTLRQSGILKCLDKKKYPKMDYFLHRGALHKTIII